MATFQESGVEVLHSSYQVSRSPMRLILTRIVTNLLTAQTVNGIRVGMIDRRMLVTADVPGHWLLWRSAKWHVVALSNGWTVGVDSFGTNFGGGVHHAFANLSVDKTLDVQCRADIPCGVVECAKCAHASAYHSKLVNRTLSPCVILKRGRLYHALSSCPKSLRGQVRLEGERLGEVDISASYLCALTSQLWEDTATQRRQKDQLIRLLQTGEFFERIADECGYAWTDRGELKRQFNMQCLFWREKNTGVGFVPYGRVCHDCSPT